MSKALALYAFESLYRELNPQSAKIKISDFHKYLKSDKNYPQSAPLFITWNKNHHLRGCIGTFLSLPTEAGVAEYALVSAFQDSRFPQISALELPLLSVSVTLLDNFEPISDPEDWEVGRHGLKVKISAGGRHYSGTFLPLVAEEQEWDRVETLWNLLSKAGYRGVSELKTLEFYESGIGSGAVQLTRYEGLKAGLDYAEYLGVRRAISGV